MVALPGRRTTINGSTPTAVGATSRSSRRSASRAATIDIGADAPAKISAPVGWGAHRLDIKSLDGDQTSIAFDVGWSGTASADTPDNVVVTLDKASYAPGDEAKLRIASHFAGKATIALVGDKIEHFIDVDLVDGDNVVPFEVGADWGPGAYAVALTHRPLDVKAKRMPGPRARPRLVRHRRGLAQARRRARRARHGAPAPAADAADQARRPRARRGGARSPSPAVDIGILNLTGFKTPDPNAYFFGQRKLPVEIRDL